MASLSLDPLRRLRGWRALAAAFLLGALAALALPPVHLVPVLLLAFPGWLALIESAGSWRRALVLGIAWGWGHQLVGLYWVTHAVLVDAATWWWLVPLAAPALALPMGAYCLVPGLAAWVYPSGWARILAVAGAWVLAELARGVLFTGFPWNLMGTVWAFDAVPVQTAAFIGVHGLSLLTVGLACLPSLGRWRPVLGGALALALLGGFGAWRTAQNRIVTYADAYVVLIQGNVRQDLKWRPEERAAIFSTLSGADRIGGR